MAKRKRQPLPVHIQQMIEQLGQGYSGALIYTGGHDLIYRCRPDGSRPDPSSVTEAGAIEFQTGLQFRVNGRRNAGWKIFVSLEPNDTYTVRLWRRALPTEQATGLAGVILDTANDVYCDDLQLTVEGMYDTAIEKFNQGFIPLI